MHTITCIIKYDRPKTNIYRVFTNVKNNGLLCGIFPCLSARSLRWMNSGLVGMAVTRWKGYKWIFTWKLPPNRNIWTGLCVIKNTQRYCVRPLIVEALWWIKIPFLPVDVMREQRLIDVLNSYFQTQTFFFFLPFLNKLLVIFIWYSEISCFYETTKYKSLNIFRYSFFSN